MFTTCSHCHGPLKKPSAYSRQCSACMAAYRRLRKEENRPFTTCSRCKGPLAKPRWGTGYCPDCVHARWMEVPEEERKKRSAAGNATRRARAARDPAYRHQICVDQNAKRYGLSVDEYEAMVLRPCAICGKVRQEGERRFTVDHCHKTGKVRDVLCSPCNMALGQFNEDPVRLRRALAYLRRHQFS